jgi:hypothetical protein
MSNLLFTTVPIEQQETIIGGLADVNIGDIKALQNNVQIYNQITIINIMFNFFIYPRCQNRKSRRRKF